MANLDNITLVEVVALGELIATLDNPTMTRICAAVAAALDCDRGA